MRDSRVFVIQSSEYSLVYVSDRDEIVSIHSSELATATQQDNR
ncbi:MAG: hypothetical protein AAF517_02380 [Planctomycetota bacterium]